MRNRKYGMSREEFLKNIRENLNKMGPSQIEEIGDYADEAFDHKYKLLAEGGFVSLLDYQFIDTMIEHYVELEEYEKCTVLLNIKNNYGQDTENKK